MKLGKIQQAWIEDLRKYPERQCNGQLGSIKNKKIEACCLGQFLLSEARIKKIKRPFFNSRIKDNDNLIFLEKAYKRLGLNTQHGDVTNQSLSLSEMNDNGIRWSVIADFIEKNAKLIFIKSV